MEEQKFELVLSTESKVLACNIQDFKAQADKFLSTLTSTFKTDEDFAKAKDEVKLLKEVEDRTREAIKNAQRGDLQDLLNQAEEIAEQFRQKRLFLDKTVKAREVEIKSEIVARALDEVIDAMSGYEKDVSIALSSKYSRFSIKARLDEATKRRSTIATLEKAVNAEKMLIVSEVSAEASRIAARRKMIPIQYEYLFKDWQDLITGEQDLEPIIAERIAEEEKREAELRAKYVDLVALLMEKNTLLSDKSTWPQLKNIEPIECLKVPRFSPKTAEELLKIKFGELWDKAFKAQPLHNILLFVGVSQ